MMSLVIPLVATKLHGNTPAVSPNVHVLTKNGEGEKIGSKYLWVKSDLICMGLCWQMNFWLRLCAPLRMHTAIAGLPFEAMELWLLWAKNAVGVLGRRVWEHVLGDVLVTLLTRLFSSMKMSHISRFKMFKMPTICIASERWGGNAIYHLATRMLYFTRVKVSRIPAIRHSRLRGCRERCSWDVSWWRWSDADI